MELGIILAYFAVILIVGLFGSRRKRDADEFFVAGRRSSSPMVTGSLLATIIGGSATVGMAGLGFTQGLTGAWWLLAGSLGLIVLGVFFARKVRRLSLYTLPELVATQYGKTVAVSASVLIVIAWVGVTAAQIIAAGKILGILGAGSPILWMAVFTVVFVVYTMLGGQRAILRTDSLQAIIIFAGIFGALALVLSRLGGISGLQDILSPGQFAFPVSPDFTFLKLASLLLLVGLTYVVGPDMYSRIFCARDDNTAKSATLWTAGLLIPAAFAITLIGMGAAALFPEIGAEQAFPTIIREVFPPLIGGIVLAALLCAVMSSADTTLLSAATILTVDIMGDMGAGTTTRNILPRSRLAIAGLGVVCLVVALLLKGVISALLFAYTVYSAGVILPVLFGFFRDKFKLTPAGAQAALIGGGATGIASKLVSVPYLDLGALALSGLLLFLVSALDRAVSRKRHQLDG